MKKTMLWGALVTLISSHAQAEVPSQTTPQQPATSVNTTLPANTSEPNANQAKPITDQIPQVQPQTLPAVMNCDYKIPADTKQIDQSIIIAWAEKAIPQSFDFDSASIDAQMQKLQTCFTEQGWQGFNTALQKSGNIEAIKAQNLSVSSQIDGKVEVTDAKENQWKLNVPLQVVYQNDKEKVTQLLQLNVTIGRKISGDLGIMQMIATPRTNTANTPTDDTNPTSTNASSQDQPQLNPTESKPVTTGTEPQNPGLTH